MRRRHSTKRAWSHAHALTRMPRADDDKGNEQRNQYRIRPTRHPVARRLTGGRAVRGGGMSQLCVKVEASARAHRRRPWSAPCDPRTADLRRPYSALYRRWTSYYYYCYGAVIFFFARRVLARVCERIFGLRAVYAHTRSLFFSTNPFFSHQRVLLHPRPLSEDDHRDRVVFCAFIIIIIIVLLSTRRVIGTHSKFDPPE